MRYRCAICEYTGGMMPPSGKCPICGQTNTYIPEPEPSNVRPTTRTATRPVAPPRTRPAPSTEKIEPKVKKEKLVKNTPAGKSGSKAKPKWNWWAAIIGFLLATGFGVNQLGLEQNSALILGGIAGIISGYYYVQIIVIGIIVFIAYALLNRH